MLERVIRTSRDNLTMLLYALGQAHVERAEFEYRNGTNRRIARAGGTYHTDCMLWLVLLHVESPCRPKIDGLS